MSKKRAKREGRSIKGRPQRGQKKRGIPARSHYHGHHNIDENFENELDHIAYHLAEEVRNMTNDWQQQAFTNILADRIPTKDRHLLQNAKNWEEFADYLSKWMTWWAQRDTSGVALLTGRIRVVAVYAGSSTGHVLGITLGYELQSPFQAN